MPPGLSPYRSAVPDDIGTPVGRAFVSSTSSPNRRATLGVDGCEDDSRCFRPANWLGQKVHRFSPFTLTVASRLRRIEATRPVAGFVQLHKTCRDGIG